LENNIIAHSTLQQLSVTFEKQDGSGKSVNVAISPNVAEGVSDAEMEGMVRSTFNDWLGQSGVLSVQDVECAKYLVDERKACSYIVSLGRPAAIQIMQVITVVENRPYIFSYSAGDKDFDNDLPIFETLLKSFNATATTTDLTTRS
jgi:hypothetical protein